MPLTPEDVRNKQFTTVRLREGYDEDEVDAFLDEVETELRRLIRENDELRAKLAAATKAASSAPQPAATTAPQQVVEKAPEPEAAPEPPKSVETPPPAPEAPVGSSSDSAARVLALAQQTADQAIAEARSEANKIVGDARSKAEAIEREARNKADALERDAQDKHRSIIGVLETQRNALEAQLDQLRQFEREYRSRLKSFLEGQLRQLDAPAESDNMPTVPVPRPQVLGAGAPRQPMRGFLIDEDEN